VTLGLFGLSHESSSFLFLNFNFKNFGGFFMSRRNSIESLFVKRKFKRTSSRKLSVGDIQVLDFLWTWKVASSQKFGSERRR
jgi:hypothetical protein